MPRTTYTYDVRDATGNSVTGQMEAETPQVVAQQLRDQGYTVVRVNEEATAGPSTGRTRIAGRVSHAERAVFYRKLATLIGAGLTVIQALHALEENITNVPLRRAVRTMLPGIERGQRMSENMRRIPDVFSPLAVAIVTAGEESGRLEGMLGVLADYAERELELHRMLKRETFYPKVLLVAILLIVPGGLLIANALAPGLFGFSALVPIGILAGLLGLCALGYYLLKSYQGSETGRLAIDRVKLSLPIFGGLTQRIAMSRFCRALASLYSAGLPLPTALQYSADACGNAALRRLLMAAVRPIEKGAKLSDVLGQHRLVPNLVLSMLRTGEQTGNIDLTLTKVADYYDDETETKVHQLGKVVTPIAILIAAIFVVLIVASFFLDYLSGIDELVR